MRLLFIFTFSFGSLISSDYQGSQNRIGPGTGPQSSPIRPEKPDCARTGLKLEKSDKTGKTG